MNPDKFYSLRFIEVTVENLMECRDIYGYSKNPTNGQKGI